MQDLRFWSLILAILDGVLCFSSYILVSTQNWFQNLTSIFKKNLPNIVNSLYYSTNSRRIQMEELNSNSLGILIHCPLLWQQMTGILPKNLLENKATLHCVWDPTKKGQWVLHVYSTAIFVASWLKWLQMSLYVSKKTTEVIWIHLKSFGVI